MFLVPQEILRISSTLTASVSPGDLPLPQCLFVVFQSYIRRSFWSQVMCRGRTPKLTVPTEEVSLKFSIPTLLTHSLRCLQMKSKTAQPFEKKYWPRCQLILMFMIWLIEVLHILSIITCTHMYRILTTNTCTLFYREHAYIKYSRSASILTCCI